MARSIPKTMLKIGIECEAIEEDTHGIARAITKLLEEIARRPELQQEFKFYLYFKSKIPNHPYLDNPIFEKRVVGPNSFSLYYYLALPIRLLFDGLDVMYFTNYMLPLIFIGKSLVLSTHDAYYEARSKNISFRYRLAYRIFATWGAVHATKVMAISEFGKQELQQAYGINPDRIVVNHLAVDPPLDVPPYSLQKYFLFVGQAFPRRHLKETLLAFEKIARTYPEVNFIFAGKDKYLPPIIENLAQEINEHLGSERVMIKEHVTDEKLASLYAGAHAVTYISSKEAFGLPPLEGLSYKALPIVADTAMSREIFGDAAFLVARPELVEDIAQALENSLINTQHHDAIFAARESILQKFTWQGHLDRFIAIVRGIAN